MKRISDNAIAVPYLFYILIKNLLLCKNKSPSTSYSMASIKNRKKIIVNLTEKNWFSKKTILPVEMS